MNGSGSPELLASNFLHVLESRKRAVVSFSPPRVFDQKGHAIPFWKQEDEANKMLGVELLFFGCRPKKSGPESEASQRRPKFWNFDFSLK